MIQCEYCGRPVKQGTEKCPSCGAPIPVHNDEAFGWNERPLDGSGQWTYYGTAMMWNGPLLMTSSRSDRWW